MNGRLFNRCKPLIWPQLALAGLVGGMVGCQTTPERLGANSAGTANNAQPCWLETPVTDSSFGQIGIARNLQVGPTAPNQISRMRAIADLCRSEGTNCDAASLEQALESESLNGKKLYFADAVKQGYVYSLAAYQPASNAQCAPLACDLSHCQPSWLCYPGADKSAVMGVSYRATSPAKQHQKAIDNALLQAEYLFGAEVTADNQLKQVSSGSQHYSVLLRSGEVDLGERESIPFYSAQQCMQGSSLYRHVIIKIDESLTGKKHPENDLAWLTNPKHQGVDGAVGAVDHPASSGLLSDQIKLAIKDAAYQLAFEKLARVQDDTTITVKEHGGVVRISYISESTETELRAQVLRIHFEPGSDSFLKVRVWLAAV